MFENDIMIYIAILLVSLAVWKMRQSKKDFKKTKHSKENFAAVNQSSKPTPVSSSAPVRQLQNVDDGIINDILNNMSEVDSESKSVISPLDAQFADDLRTSGGPSNDIKPNESGDQSAAYGQGYSLGVDMNDTTFSRFTAQAPSNKNQMISDDLLPKKNEKWFETPKVGTNVEDANLLADAMFKTGINTTGNTKRIACYDIRGNIPAPKFNVGPWNNSSYDPDTNLSGFCN